MQVGIRLPVMHSETGCLHVVLFGSLLARLYEFFTVS